MALNPLKFLRGLRQKGEPEPESAPEPPPVPTTPAERMDAALQRLQAQIPPIEDDD